MPSPTRRLRDAGCVFAEAEAALLTEAAGGDAATLEALTARRVAGEPLEHVLGRAELAGHRWSVGPGVFVPRRRSELLVDVGADLAVAVARDAAGSGVRRRPVVLDLCCGCGAVGGAVLLAARERGVAVVLHASDVDPAATAHATANVAPLGGTVHTGDLFVPLPPGLRGRVDVLLCHAPYVPTRSLRTLPHEARDHEPVVALDGGGDGLDVVRRVVADASGWLAPGGSLLVEVGEGQVEAATAVFDDAGLRVDVVRGDDEPWDDELLGGAGSSAPGGTPGGTPVGGLVVVATRP